MEPFYSKANQLHFAQPNCLKYLILSFFGGQEEVKKNLLNSCTQLEKFGCYFKKSEVDIVSQCIRLNSESLKCLEISVELDKTDEMSFFKLATAISECQQLEELSLLIDGQPLTYHFLPGNLKKLHLSHDGKLKIEDMKVLVGTCSKLEDMFLFIFSCCDSFRTDKLEDSTCRQFDDVLSTIVESSLSDTLVNLSLVMGRIVIDEKQFYAKILRLGQMKKLKNIVIFDCCEGDDSHRSKVKEMISKNLPHLTVVDLSEGPDDCQARLKMLRAHNIFRPANPYAKFSDGYRREEGLSGFWEIPCSRLSMFPDHNAD